MCFLVSFCFSISVWSCLYLSFFLSSWFVFVVFVLLPFLFLFPFVLLLSRSLSLFVFISFGVCYAFFVSCFFLFLRSGGWFAFLVLKSLLLHFWFVAFSGFIIWFSVLIVLSMGAKSSLPIMTENQHEFSCFLLPGLAGRRMDGECRHDEVALVKCKRNVIRNK